MKLSQLVLYTVALTSSMAVAKNVLDLEALKLAVEQETSSNHDKRDGDEMSDGFTLKLEKREAKNVFKFPAAGSLHGSNTKRGTNANDDSQVVFNYQANDNLLQSIIPTIDSISYFAAYIRDDVDVAKLTERESAAMLIISPSNAAIESKLQGLKPWEFPQSLNDAKSEQEEESIVQHNLHSFLAGHVVADLEHGLAQNEDQLDVNELSGELLDGRNVAIRQDVRTGQYSVKVGGLAGGYIPVEVARKVNNGYLFIIDDVLVKP